MELIRTVIVPILIALSTIIVSHRINERSKRKNESKDAANLADLFYLRLLKLITSLDEYNKLLRNSKEIRREYYELKNGVKSFSSDDHEGVSKEDYMDFLLLSSDDIKDFTSLDKISEIHENLSALKVCSIDKISPKERYNCMRVIEMQPQLKILFQELPFFIQLSDSLKPKYK